MVAKKSAKREATEEEIKAMEPITIGRTKKKLETVKEEKKEDPVTPPKKERKRKLKDPDAPVKPKRKHTWTEANRKIFYEKCVPARLKALEAKRAAKASQTEETKEIGRAHV